MEMGRRRPRGEWVVSERLEARPLVGSRLGSEHPVPRSGARRRQYLGLGWRESGQVATAHERPCLIWLFMSSCCPLLWDEYRV